MCFQKCSLLCFHLKQFADSHLVYTQIGSKVQCIWHSGILCTVFHKNVKIVHSRKFWIMDFKVIKAWVFPNIHIISKYLYYHVYVYSMKVYNYVSRTIWVQTGVHTVKDKSRCCPFLTITHPPYSLKRRPLVKPRTFDTTSLTSQLAPRIL